VFYLANAAAPKITKLGAFNYDTDESTPLWYNNRTVIMETMSNATPDHVFDCGTYFEVRDLTSWKTIVSLKQSCNHAFGSAYVSKNPNGTETLWIYGTRWTRFDGVGGPLWDGPCSKGECAVDVFWSSDPNLQVWWNATAFEFPKGWTVYNIDAAQVDPAALAKYNPGVPSHRWIMACEHGVSGGYNDNFLINNGITPDKGKWELLNDTFFIKSEGGNNIGSCPTVRYVPSTGHFYVITGGSSVWIIRSQDLKHWERGHYNDGKILSPNNADDCKVISSEWSAWKPTEKASNLLSMSQCTHWDTNNSDADIAQIVLHDGSVGTIILFDALDQATLGFPELALYHGTMESYLAANFM